MEQITLFSEFEEFMGRKKMKNSWSMKDLGVKKGKKGRKESVKGVVKAERYVKVKKHKALSKNHSKLKLTKKHPSLAELPLNSDISDYSAES